MQKSIKKFLKHNHDFLLIGVIAALAFFIPLSFSLVFQVSEAREGTVIKEMLESDNLILPLRHGVYVPSKPPLAHWVGYCISQVFGLGSSEFLIRLPAAIFATLLLFAQTLFLRSYLSKHHALVGAIVFSTTYGVARLGTDGRVDMVFSALAVVAVLVWLRALLNHRESSSDAFSPSARTVFLFYLFCGLAAVAKGPLGVALPGFIAAALTIYLRGVKALTSFFRWPILLVVLVPAPWYYLAYLEAGDAFLQRHLFFENFERFTGGEGISIKPWWFYLEKIWGQGAPWLSFIAVVYLVSLFKALIGKPDYFFSALSGSERTLQRAAVVWFLSTLFLFSLSEGKRRGYLLPALPAIALWWAASTDSLKAALASWHSRRPWLSITTYYFLWAGCALFLAVLLFIPPETLLGLRSSPKAAVIFEGLSDLRSRVMAIPLLLFLLLFTICSYLARRRESARFVLYSWLGLALFLSSLAIPLGMALKAEAHTHLYFAMEVDEFLPKDAELRVIKRPEDETFDGFLFYFPRSVKIEELGTEPQPATYYLLRAVDRSNVKGFRDEQVVLRGGSRIDKRSEQLLLIAPKRLQRLR